MGHSGSARISLLPKEKAAVMRPADRLRSCLSPATPTLRLLAPMALLALLAPAPTIAVPQPSSAPAPLPAAVQSDSDELASVRREVRLRKLHLVRPDLIQYPLSYDVFC